MRLVICGDDDRGTPGNPGRTKAEAAAHAVGGLAVFPAFPSGETGTDFNDMAQSQGLEAVKAQILDALATHSKRDVSDVSGVQANADATFAATAGEAVAVAGVAPDALATHSKPGVSGVSGVQASADAGFTDTPPETPEVSGVSPTEAERPCFRVLDEWAEVSGARLRPGVWFFGVKAGKDGDATLTQQWVCSPLHIEAVTHDGQASNFGRLLRFRNSLGDWREWSMPMELLAADGADLRRELLSMGLLIDPNAHRLLGAYLQAQTPSREIRCSLSVGWVGGSFVLPDAVIGWADVIFQSSGHGPDEYTQAGTLDGWRAEIAARAAGNPLLILTLSCAFAGPLLAKTNSEGGGVHFVGDSSTGKTTLLEAACSVWGGPNYRRSWRATSNGLEGAAALFNDSLLALDEISECAPQEVGQIVYALANGRGKQRAGRTGNARALTRFRVSIVSSGERTIATAMAEGGFRAKAGQQVRLLDVPASRTHGAWDDLHGLPSGQTFSDAIKQAAATHYGRAGRAFLERLTRDAQDLCAALERITWDAMARSRPSNLERMHRSRRALLLAAATP